MNPSELGQPLFIDLPQVYEEGLPQLMSALLGQSSHISPYSHAQPFTFSYRINRPCGPISHCSVWCRGTGPICRAGVLLSGCPSDSARVVAQGFGAAGALLLLLDFVVWGGDVKCKGLDRGPWSS